MTDVLAELRAQTREAHERLEQRLTVFGAEFSRAAYAQYLDRFLGVLIPAEAQAFASPAFVQALPDLATRSKLAFVRTDLAALGGQESGQHVVLPTMTSVPEFFGVFYVLEGSTLGGAVLARRVEAQLDSTCTHYFRCYGAELGPRFRTFCAAMAAHCAQDAARTVVIARAIRTFELVEAWLESGGLLR